MKTLKDYPIKELKLIYNLLHAQIPAHIKLMDSILLQDLQHHLLSQAKLSGINIGKPLEWANWLNK